MKDIEVVEMGLTEVMCNIGNGPYDLLNWCDKCTCHKSYNVKLITDGNNNIVPVFTCNHEGCSEEGKEKIKYKNSNTRVDNKFRTLRIIDVKDEHCCSNDDMKKASMIFSDNEINKLLKEAIVNGESVYKVVSEALDSAVSDIEENMAIDNLNVENTLIDIHNAILELNIIKKDIEYVLSNHIDGAYKFRLLRSCVDMSEHVDKLSKIKQLVLKKLN